MKSKQVLTLISHTLCPYVQRVVAALEAKGLPYHRVNIDLDNKPAWFKKLSPLGKVPLLVVDDNTVLFESAVISEYINEISGGELLPDDPLTRANHRSWLEFASATLNNIGQLYSAVDEQSFLEVRQLLNVKFSRLEDNLADSAYFNGVNFSLVDAAFAPVFRYLDVFEQWDTFNFLSPYPKIMAWQKSLLEHAVIKRAVADNYPQLLAELVAKRRSYLGVRARDHTKHLNGVAYEC